MTTYMIQCCHCPIADDMNDDERQLWTEQILQWMCSTDTGPEIRFACGQALAGINCTYLAAMQGGP